MQGNDPDTVPLGETLGQVSCGIRDNRDRHAEYLKAAMDWERAATGVFLAGYKAAATGLASVPQQESAFDQLLDLFLIEKALYEMRYELDSRPQWASIPIRGLIGLLDKDIGR